jgi:integrase
MVGCIQVLIVKERLMPTYTTERKRTTRSDKFPLTLHPTGQYCKKIKNKLYYFGTDKREAHRRYVEQAAALHAGRQPMGISSDEAITIKLLANIYLDHQQGKVEHGEMSAQYYADEIRCLKNLVLFLGQHTLIREISTLDLQNYKRKLSKKYSSSRLNLNIAVMKAMFHWAVKNEVIQKAPNIDAVNKVKITRKKKATFTSEQIHKLLEKAALQMKVMIWLGLNCGFGCTDCSELLWQHVDLERGRIDYPRGKTGVDRNLPLWPETVMALKALPNVNHRVFNTCRGNAWVRVIEKVDGNGVTKFSKHDGVTKAFATLMKEAGVELENRAGFYSLRRTAATWAARSGDPFAVQRLLGHADLKMASIYVQDISEQTDRAINNSRKFIVQDNS